MIGCSSICPELVASLIDFVNTSINVGLVNLANVDVVVVFSSLGGARGSGFTWGAGETSGSGSGAFASGCGAFVEASSSRSGSGGITCGCVG
jgi:hypothetical protein